VKSAIISKVFGTLSKTEIEKMDSHVLEGKRKDLEKLLNILKNEAQEDPINFINEFDLQSAA
jgi:hypothetical protein